MKRSKIIKYHCATDGWVNSNPCVICGGVTTERVLPARRDGAYFLKDLDYPVPSVTTILKVLAKPGLERWFKTQAAEIAFANPDLDKEGVLREMGKRLVAAGDRGSAAHDAIATGTAVAPEYQGYLDAYEKFCVAFPHETLLAEKIVYTTEYAGKFDRLIRDATGQLWIVDFKTNNAGLFAETGLQLSAYKHATHLEKEPGLSGEPTFWKAAKLMGVHIAANGTFATQEYPDSYETFLACLSIHQWKENN